MTGCEIHEGHGGHLQCPFAMLPWCPYVLPFIIPIWKGHFCALFWKLCEMACTFWEWNLHPESSDHKMKDRVGLNKNVPLFSITRQTLAYSADPVQFYWLEKKNKIFRCRLPTHQWQKQWNFRHFTILLRPQTSPLTLGAVNQSETLFWKSFGPQAQPPDVSRCAIGYRLNS